MQGFIQGSVTTLVHFLILRGHFWQNTWGTLCFLSSPTMPLKQPPLGSPLICLNYTHNPYLTTTRFAVFFGYIFLRIDCLYTHIHILAHTRIVFALLSHWCDERVSLPAEQTRCAMRGFCLDYFRMATPMVCLASGCCLAGLAKTKFLPGNVPQSNIIIVLDSVSVSKYTYLGLRWACCSHSLNLN